MIRLFPARAVAVEVLGFGIHWYGLLYFAAFLLAYALLPRLQKLRGLTYTRDEWATLLAWAVGGVILGGRLGFVLFYEPLQYLAHPLEILAVWHGGMASHGGFLGVTLALLWALRGRSREEILRIADVVVVPAALGLALGRVGNFINQELYGPPTSLPWGILIPGEPGPVHPTQLYAVAKDLLIAGVCFWHLRSTVRTHAAGRTFAVFLLLYGVLRFLIEYLRVQPYGWTPILGIPFTRGQILTVFIALAGGWLWWWAGSRKRRKTP